MESQGVARLVVDCIYLKNRGYYRHVVESSIFPDIDPNDAELVKELDAMKMEYSYVNGCHQIILSPLKAALDECQSHVRDNGGYHEILFTKYPTIKAKCFEFLSILEICGYNYSSTDDAHLINKKNLLLLVPENK